MSRGMTAYATREAPAMRHYPAGAAIVIMLRSLKMPGMAQAVQDLMDLMDRAMVRHWFKNNGEGGACI
jgi:hypothetical protein